jgi:hypothetical protein
MIPSPAPIAAPVIKPSMVVLVIDGVLLTNIKPAAAIHKVQRTMRIFMGVLPTAALCRYRHWLQVYSKGGQPFNRVKIVLLPIPMVESDCCDHGSKSYRARKNLDLAETLAHKSTRFSALFVENYGLKALQCFLLQHSCQIEIR